MTSSDDFPAEFPSDPQGSAKALRWTTEVLALTALALAVLNPEAIVNWTEDLPAAPSTAKAMAAADAWHNQSAALGLDSPRKVFHHAWKRAQTARWPDDGHP
jgi:hypothetical protein